MNIHCIGIGGIGLSTIAQFCHNRGDVVTGSDQKETEIVPLLRKKGISVFIPQSSENIPKNCDIVLYSQAVSEENPERRVAQKQNIPQYSYFQFLGEISKQFYTIAVAGTHGKTSTCGMIASGMKAANCDTTFFVGAQLTELDGSNFYAGSNSYAVIEACEYKQNFQYLVPDVVLVTNIEWDHPDYYLTEASYKKAFQSFLSKAKTVIYHEKDTEVASILAPLSLQKIAIPDYGEDWGKRIEKPEPHNQENAALAFGLAHYLQIPEKQYIKGLQRFKGASRRQEYLGMVSGVSIFDDYGHHPTEIKKTIEGFRKKFPKSKIALVFEPHQFSRTRVFWREFIQALQKPDFLGLFPIYEARDTEKDKKEIRIEALRMEIPDAHFVKTYKDLAKIQKKLKKDDVLIFMGAGDISQWARKWVLENQT